MLKKTNGRAPSLISAAMRGTGMSVVWTLVSSGVVAKLLDAEMMRMEQMGYTAMAILVTAGAIGTWQAGKKAGQKQLPAGVISLVGYMLCLLAVNGLMFGGAVTGLWADMMTLVIGGGIGMLLSRKGRREAKRKRYKMRR